MKKSCSKCKREYDSDASRCFRCGISLNPEPEKAAPPAPSSITKKINPIDIPRLQQPASATLLQKETVPQNKPSQNKPPVAPRAHIPVHSQTQNQSQDSTASANANGLPPTHRRPLPVPKPKTTTTTSAPSQSQPSNEQPATFNKVNSQGSNQPSFDKLDNQQKQDSTFSFESFNPSESSVFQQQEEFFNTPASALIEQKQKPAVNLQKTQAPAETWNAPIQNQVNYAQPYVQQNAFQQQPQQQYNETKDTTSPFQRQTSFTSQPYTDSIPTYQQPPQSSAGYEKTQPVQQQPYYNYNEASTPSPVQQQPVYEQTQQQQYYNNEVSTPSPTYSGTPNLPYQKVAGAQTPSPSSSSPYFFPVSNSEIMRHHKDKEKEPHHGRLRNFFSRSRQDPKSNSQQTLTIPTQSAQVPQFNQISQVNPSPYYSSSSEHAQLTPIATECPIELTNKPQKLWPHEEAAMVKYNQQQNRTSQNYQNSARRLQALWDCSADQEGDLEFSFGDIIIVLQESDSGWWQGQLETNGKVGVFPVNYTAECNY
eukprot:TRINITY_DN3598_c0_g1_i2.p1 TRINITY_DN3598_c0_g1~~TRINITY_DN3598_c0_g1_i2.p1  ORF type:complete len:537 (+),score=125.78 TRINITY_DN3598_c0_g1_i2:338-1948(+)